MSRKHARELFCSNGDQKQNFAMVLNTRRAVCASGDCQPRFALTLRPVTIDVCRLKGAIPLEIYEIFGSIIH